MYAVPSTVGRMVTEPDAEVRRFCELFPAAYLAFHRRDGKRDQLSGASRAVLLHLAQTGPLTVGEAAVHLDRAQSVVSEIVNQLEGHGYVERENDPDDRRRTFIWLTPTGRQRLERDAQVLDPDLVGRAFLGLTTQQRQGLIEALAALVASARGIPNPPERERDS